MIFENVSITEKNLINLKFVQINENEYKLIFKKVKDNFFDLTAKKENETITVTNTMGNVMINDIVKLYSYISCIQLIENKLNQNK